jgi:type II secretory pathway component PulM
MQTIILSVLLIAISVISFLQSKRIQSLRKTLQGEREVAAWMADKAQEQHISDLSRVATRSEIITDLLQQLTDAHTSLEMALAQCQSNIKGVSVEIGPAGLSGIDYEFHTQDKEVDHS